MVCTTTPSQDESTRQIWEYYLIHESASTYKSRYKKGDETKIRAQQYIQLNTGAKEIQLLNRGGYVIRCSNRHQQPHL